MKLDYDNQRTRGKAAFLEAAEAEEKTPFDIFEEIITESRIIRK